MSASAYTGAGDDGRELAFLADVVAQVSALPWRWVPIALLLFTAMMLLIVVVVPPAVLLVKAGIGWRHVIAADEPVPIVIHPGGGP